MFTETWRKHWSLAEAPFAHEDADKDPILSKLEAFAVHSSFDRLFGDPSAPEPGIVFGEKGSGKSGLRLAMERRLEEHNRENPGARVFCVPYTDFDAFLDRVRQAEGIASGKSSTPAKTVARFDLADHVDAILSLGVTQLVDELIEDRPRARRIDAKHKADLLALTGLYYRSDERSRIEAAGRLRSALRYATLRAPLLDVLRVALTIGAVALALIPHLGAFGFGGENFDPGPRWIWYGAGAVLFWFTWVWTLVGRWGLRSAAHRASRSVRVVPRDPVRLAKLMAGIRPALRRELLLPREHDEASRHLLLGRFVSVLRAAGYRSLYVLMDRVDEATLLAGKEDWMQPFVERLLEHKLLQFDGLALKLFLPIELSKLYLGAAPSDLKRMRLDKANTVGELRWLGQELYEAANQRLRAARTPGTNGAAGGELADYFGPEVEAEDVKAALHELGTPRHAFGFLGTLFGEYARNLPEELDDGSERWKVPSSHFQIVRASWADRSRQLRRTMN